MTNLSQRILTALIGLPFVLGAVYAGGWLYLALLVVVAVTAQIEFYRMSGRDERHALRAIGLVVGALLVLVVRLPQLWPAIVVAGIGLMVYATLYAGRRPVWEGLAWVLAGIVYPAFFVSQLALLRLREGGAVDGDGALWLTAALVAAIWGNDTLAYATGRTFGRRPLAPAISPKKTWEGAAGGVVGALGALLAVKAFALPFLPWHHAVALGLLAGVGGEVGDLVESRLKREWGVKDSGAMLPGHGGMLDRVDALIFTAPLFVLYLTYVARVYA